MEICLHCLNMCYQQTAAGRNFSVDSLLIAFQGHMIELHLYFRPLCFVPVVCGDGACRQTIETTELWMMLDLD